MYTEIYIILAAIWLCSVERRIFMSFTGLRPFRPQLHFSKVFYVLAFLLFGAMCAVVAYNYCDMTWGIKYAGYSAPAWTAFMTAIPFAIAIATCIGIALHLKRR